MTAVQPEKRRDQRVDTALPVFLENATGVTRDVSASGVFFWTSGTHAIGESISFSMRVQRPEGNVMLKCRGDVVRTEPRGTHVGVAVAISESVMEPA
ncbi:MAG: PilZ domain-containing protein [Betaproteobacteria bacterium]|nr:PilZ domain-containing protein [Betaproteobacteria bacterium]MDH3438322.1 PilZ domain-containing protein [Betaproteobacteria bacterium]